MLRIEAADYFEAAANYGSWKCGLALHYGASVLLVGITALEDD